MTQPLPAPLPLRKTAYQPTLNHARSSGVGETQVPVNELPPDGGEQENLPHRQPTTFPRSTRNLQSTWLAEIQAAFDAEDEAPSEAISWDPVVEASIEEDVQWLNLEIEAVHSTILDAVDPAQTHTLATGATLPHDERCKRFDGVPLQCAHKTSPEPQPASSLSEQPTFPESENLELWDTLTTASLIQHVQWLESLLSDTETQLEPQDHWQKLEEKDSALTPPPVTNLEISKTGATPDACKLAPRMDTDRKNGESLALISNKRSALPRKTGHIREQPSPTYLPISIRSKGPQRSCSNNDQVFTAIAKIKEHHNLSAPLHQMIALVDPALCYQFTLGEVAITAEKRSASSTIKLVFNYMPQWTDPQGEYKLTPQQIKPLCMKANATSLLKAMHQYFHYVTDPSGSYHLDTEAAFETIFSSHGKVKKFKNSAPLARLAFPYRITNTVS